MKCPMLLLPVLLGACQFASGTPNEPLAVRMPDRPAPADRTIALPDERPIWKVFSKLECEGTIYIQCFHPRGSCVRDQSEAHIIVDFQSEHLAWIGSQSDGQRIVGRAFRHGWFYEHGHIAPQSAVYLSDPATALNFGGRSIDEEEIANPRSIPATLTHTDGYETFVHRMRCVPVTD